MIWQHNLFTDVPGEIDIPGTLASPSVLDYDIGTEDLADTVVPADDGEVYGFDNIISAFPPLDWQLPVSPWTDFCSGTCAVTNDRYVVLYTEESDALWVYEFGTLFARATFELQLGVNHSMVFGAPVLDLHERLFLITPGSPPVLPDDHGRQCLAYQIVRDNGIVIGLSEVWKFPGSRPFIPDITSSNWPGSPAPLAMADDGTIVAVAYDPATWRTYVYAIRPLLGDFNGDGCANNFDIDACVLALNDQAAWETQYGEVWGINLLGVADGDNNGVFDGNDIDELLAAWNAGQGDGCSGQDFAEPEGLALSLLELMEWMQ